MIQDILIITILLMLVIVFLLINRINVINNRTKEHYARGLNDSIDILINSSHTMAEIFITTIPSKHGGFRSLKGVCKDVLNEKAIEHLKE